MPSSSKSKIGLPLKSSWRCTSSHQTTNTVPETLRGFIIIASIQKKYIKTTVVEISDVRVVSNLSVEVGHQRSNVLGSSQPLMQKLTHVEETCINKSKELYHIFLWI